MTSAPVRRTATVASVVPHARGVVVRLEIPDRADHLPGQHYVLRLTAEDGYVAQRSYSIASAPSDPQVELYVERLRDGEVSTFLADDLLVGDELEVQGPIGGWFVWDGREPALGFGGGSGVVPLVAMSRHARDVGRPDLLRIVASGATEDSLPYAGELRAAGAFVALTQADAPARPAGRLTAAEVGAAVRPDDLCFVCGSARFTGAVDDLLRAAGATASRIRFERFGPTG